MIPDLPEQLIQQAEFLLRSAPGNQANVRRAVSAAYYSLFHLLVRDAVARWKDVDQHSNLARVFDHKRMREASAMVVRQLQSHRGSLQAGPDPGEQPHSRLILVAEAFVDLQNARHKADYDIGGEFPTLLASEMVAQARLAFAAWMEVREEPIAQPYLYSLLFRERV